MTGINLLPYAAPIRSSVCQQTEFPKRTMISGRRILFLPSPSPLSFFLPSSYRKGYYFYSPQSSTVIKSKMATTTILRTRTRFRPPKISLHCRLVDYLLLKRNNHSFVVVCWGRVRESRDYQFGSMPVLEEAMTS